MDAGNRLLLARALAKAARPERAEDEVLEAIRLKPGQPESYGFYGEILESTRRWKEAAHAFILSGYFGSPQAAARLENVERKRREDENAR
jgi:hypothetical protein